MKMREVGESNSYFQNAYLIVVSMSAQKYVENPLIWPETVEARLYAREGIEVSGQTVRYLITDAENRRSSKRVKVAELINAETRFDAGKYVEMLILAATNILSPFGYTQERLKDHIVYGERQTMLRPVLRTT